MAWLSLLFATAVAAFSSNCKVVTFTVTGSAQNKNITSSFPTTTLDALVSAYQAAPFLTVSGPQTLSGTYCAPTVVNSNNAKLQVLFHSITGNRGGYAALGGPGTDFPQYRPEYYSFERYFNALGYPTLNMDRLGNGKSSHPDPILVVQAPYEIALYIDLARQIRANTGNQLPRAYNYLIYFGNSYGSQLGVGIADANATAYNDFILTGFTQNVRNGFLGVNLVLPAPAAVVDPARFGTLPLGYVTTSSEVGRTNSFFGSKAQVDFEDTVAHLFFTRKDVVSLGQFVSVYGLDFRAPKYTGKVFVLDGENDQPFCGPGSPVLGPAYCGTQLAETKALLPLSQYNYKTVNRIGHGVQLHIRTPVLYAIAAAYLAGVSFQGGPPA